MNNKETFFIKIIDSDSAGVIGIGECALFRGLSSDDTPQYESKLSYICHNINNIRLEKIKESSIRFGLETALNDLKNGGQRIIFQSPWQQGHNPLIINGLIWMGDFDTMMLRVREKIEAGFKCIKLKIGGIDFNKELQILSAIRDELKDDVLQIRLDANGSFTSADALKRLEKLARYDVHSIEQPIKAGNWPQMREITKYSPIPIALDEELIGNMDYDLRNFMLDATMPAYIILKPSLAGGFSTCDKWIEDATLREIGWWATSALESNIGLNAIAQWSSSKNVSMPQGLGTGALYSNNIASPLEVIGETLNYNSAKTWDIPFNSFSWK